MFCFLKLNADTQLELWNSRLKNLAECDCRAHTETWFSFWFIALIGSELTVQSGFQTTTNTHALSGNRTHKF